MSPGDRRVIVVESLLPLAAGTYTMRCSDHEEHVYQQVVPLGVLVYRVCGACGARATAEAIPAAEALR